MLSWDLILELSSDEWCQENKKFQEDSLIASCLKTLGHGLTSASDPEEIYDEPYSHQGWAHEYTPRTLFIHRMKRNDWFLKASLHFLGYKFPVNIMKMLTSYEWNPNSSLGIKS